MKKDEMLVPRLDFLMPKNFFLSEEWQLNFGVDGNTAIGRVAELNPEWVIEVVNNLNHRLSDVLHDFKGIYSEDEHFLPRISTDKEYTFDEVWDALIEYEFATEDELRLVCHINGSSIETLNDVLEVRTTYKDWSQFKSFEI